MLERKNILMIGGTGRNVGKTEFVCQCIKHFSKKYNIIALKVTNHFHVGQIRTYSVMEEKDNNTQKDTSRMLRAGAQRVYYVQSEKEFLSQSFAEFEKIEGKESLIICESNGLRDIVTPGVFIIVSNTNKPEVKESALEKLKIADKIIVSNGNEFNILPETINVVDNKWVVENS